MFLGNLSFRTIIRDHTKLHMKIFKIILQLPNLKSNFDTQKYVVIIFEYNISWSIQIPYLVCPFFCSDLFGQNLVSDFEMFLNQKKTTSRFPQVQLWWKVALVLHKSFSCALFLHISFLKHPSYTFTFVLQLFYTFQFALSVFYKIPL